MFIKIVLILYFFTLCVCDDSLLSQFDKKIPTLDDGSLDNVTSILRKAVHLDLPEGADCEWEGVKGKCVKETRCLTTVGPGKIYYFHPVCSTKGDDKIVCCTDCELVNSTRNVVFGQEGPFWKDGTKARDSCFDYLKTLQSMCRGGSNYDIYGFYNEEKQCYISRQWTMDASPAAIGVPDGVEYPHQALLGYGNDLESAKWEASGTIISNKYILTVAHIGKLLFQVISFNQNVLPACLPVHARNDDSAFYTTWIQLESSYYMADAGVRARAGNSGEPLLISFEFKGCISTVIGVMSFGRSQCGSKHNYPDVYTRVEYYKPWIESIVWA